MLDDHLRLARVVAGFDDTDRSRCAVRWAARHSAPVCVRLSSAANRTVRASVVRDSCTVNGGSPWRIALATSSSRTMRASLIAPAAQAAGEPSVQHGQEGGIRVGRPPLAEWSGNTRWWSSGRRHIAKLRRVRAGRPDDSLTICHRTPGHRSVITSAHTVAPSCE